MPVRINSKLLKRTPAQREQDIVDIASMCIKGFSYTKISEYISSQRGYALSRAQICLDAKKAVARWREQANESIDTIKARDLAKLDAIEAAAWQAWDRSVAKSERTTEEKISTPDEDENPKLEAPLKRLARHRKSRLTINRDGDPRFLQVIFDCIRQRGIITGYAKPELPTGGEERIDNGEQKAIEQALVIAYGASAIEKAIPVQSTVTPETATGTTPAPQPAKTPDWIAAAEAQK